MFDPNKNGIVEYRLLLFTKLIAGIFVSNVSDSSVSPCEDDSDDRE